MPTLPADRDDALHRFRSGQPFARGSFAGQIRSRRRDVHPPPRGSGHSLTHPDRARAGMNPPA